MSHFNPNIDNNAVDVMREESVYIDEDNYTQKDSQPIAADDLNIQTTQAPCTNNLENIVRRNSFRIKRGKENDSRWVTEQTNRLRQRFDLSPSDELVASCSAAMFKRIILRGRLYITTHYLCFYTNMFGKVTKEAFPYISIAQVEKRRGGLVANAIKLSFADDDVSPIIIGSLTNREKVFSLIQERLQILNPTASEQNVKDGNRNSAFSRNNSIIEPILPENSASTEFSLDSIVASTETDIIEESSTESKDLRSTSQAIEDNETSKTRTSAPNEQLKPKAEELLTSLVWCTPDDIVGGFSSTSYSKRTERARIVLNASVKEVFNLLYISDWLKQYHQEVQNYDVEITEWLRDVTGRMYRDVRFRRPLELKIGPKETRVNEKQWITYTDQEGVVIEVQGMNLDVPYSSYFVVESFFEMSPINNGIDTLLVVSVSVSFSKRTFLQGQIESGALSETKNVYEKLVALAKKRVDEHLVERAARQVPKTSMRAVRGEVGTALEPDEDISERSSEARTQETETHQNVKRVAEQYITAAVEGNKHLPSYEVPNPRIYIHPSQIVAPDENFCDTAIKLEHTDHVSSYLSASLFVLVVTSVLLAVLHMRVERLFSSSQKVIFMLEKGVSDSRC